MDQLDILKQKWQSQTYDAPQFTKEQLTGLLAKKSSSIVKWLLIIAVIEFAFFAILGMISHFYNDSYDVMNTIGSAFYYGSMILHYSVVFIFIYLFYQNYRNISTTQPARSLMNTILKTRRTMKWYIWYNLIYIMVIGMTTTIMVILNDPRIAEMMESRDIVGHETAFIAVYVGISFVVFLIICAIMYLLYFLIYGFLLRKLKRNYNELKRIEV